MSGWKDRQVCGWKEEGREDTWVDRRGGGAGGRKKRREESRFLSFP